MNPSKPGHIEKIVLKASNHNVSPVFRISESPATLFISHQAKMALEKAGVIGCVFEKVEIS